MAIDAGLLAGPPNLAARPELVPKVDYVGQQDKMYKLSEEQDTYRDKMYTQEALKNGADLITPEGTKAFLEQAKGKVSPTYYGELIKHYEGAEKRSRDIQDYYLKLPPEIVKAEMANQDALVGAAQEAYGEYEKDFANAGGEQVARENLKNHIKVRLGKLANLKGPDGQPLIPLEKFDEIAKMSPPELKTYIAQTHWGKEQAKLAAEIREKNAKARQAETKADVQSAGDPNAIRINYLRDWLSDNADEKGSLQYDTNEKELNFRLSRAGGGKGGAGGEVNYGTSEGQNVAAMQKLFFGEEPKGMGQQAVQIRTRIRDLAAQTGKALGLTDMDMAMLPHDSKAKYKAIDGLTKWGSMVAKSQVNLEKDLDVATYYAEKLGSVAIKKINEMVIAGKSQFGDGDAQAYGLAVQKIRSEYMRLQTGPTSNAMLPVEAQQRSDQLISTGITAENWRGPIRDAITWEARNAVKSVEDTTNSLRNSVQSAGGAIQPPPNTQPPKEPALTAPPSAPAAKYPEVVNPQTHERLIFKDGKWQPKLQ